MKIGVVQLQPVKGNLQANIAAHQKWIELAATHQVQALFFPELSITGFEPELASELATTQEDPRFDLFQDLSKQHNMCIGVGVPTRVGEAIQISMLLFQAQTARQTYSKQLLHEDELPYFIPGKAPCFLKIGHHTIAPAICYEAMQPEHAAQASKNGATVYLASVAKSSANIAKANQYFPNLAKKHAMWVLMANCIGPADNFEGAGQSAIWNTQGELIGQLKHNHQSLLIVDTAKQELTEMPFSTSPVSS